MTACLSAGRTDTGKVRRRNEDALLLRDDLGLWVVADGLGGHAMGDHASQRITERLGSLTRAGSQLDFIEAIEDVLADVNDELRRLASERGGDLIASTVAMLVDGPDFMLCGWVGDSRVYCREAPDLPLRCVTRDHVVDSGLSSVPAGASALTRAVGAQGLLAVDWQVASARPGSRFLLCSDGVNKELPDPDLARLLAVEASPAHMVDEIFAQSLARGARDNVTAIVVHVTG